MLTSSLSSALKTNSWSSRKICGVIIRTISLTVCPYFEGIRAVFPTAWFVFLKSAGYLLECFNAGNFLLDFHTMNIHMYTCAHWYIYTYLDAYTHT